MAAPERALLLTGLAGVGKSLVAQAVGGILTAAGQATAVVDTDALAQFALPPSASHLRDGHFYDELKCANLAAVWPNFRAAGARFIVVAAGIDSQAPRDLYAQSLAGCDVRLVRLTADDDTLRRRLRQRDAGPKLDRHLRAVEERKRAPAAPRVEDFAIVNDGDVAVVARQILVQAGWLDR